MLANMLARGLAPNSAYSLQPTAKLLSLALVTTSNFMLVLGLVLSIARLG